MTLDQVVLGGEDEDTMKIFGCLLTINNTQKQHKFVI